MNLDFKPNRSELRKLLRAFKRGLKDLSPGDLAPESPCPNSSRFAAFVVGTLDDESQKDVNAHIAFCDDCFEEFVALAGPEQIAQILTRDASQPGQQAFDELQKFIERLKQVVIDLGRQYGPGSFIGPVRVVTEQMVFAVRGGKTSRVPSKVFEVPVGENSYTLAVTSDEHGGVACDIAGTATLLKKPLQIKISSGTGIQLAVLRTDEFGNSTFVLPKLHDPDTTYVLLFMLGADEQKVFLRVPEAI